MDHEATALRRELSRVEKGRGKRYPRELRSRVATWAGERHRAGISWEQIKRELGQRFDTVRRWCVEEKSSKVRAIVPVRVIADRRSERLLSVVSPNGFRVDGLSLSEAAALLREVG
jgi:hypothetical protein